MENIPSSEFELLPRPSENTQEQQKIVTCPVCFDDIATNDHIYVVACCDLSHPGFHKDCLCHYIKSKVDEGFPGTCPSMVCPCQHADKRRRILRFTTWKSVTTPDISQKYQGNAESLLAFLCSNCHVLRTISIPYTEEDCNKAIEYLREKMNNPLKYQSFITDIEAYNSGELTVVELYDKISTQYFPGFQSDEDKDVWFVFKHILHLFEDPERRANLHLRHLKIRPRMWTPCCTKEHCFRCRTKDFHTGKTCEQNTKSLDSTIVPCPSCGLYLTKGDGCNSVTCVCGKKFSWNEEKETNERTSAFLIAFPENTSSYCAQVLCQSLEGSETNALAWRSRHTVAVNQSILKHWRHLYPYCPHQAIALLDITKLSHGRQIAVEVWESKYGVDVKKCRIAIEKARDTLFLALYPNQIDRFHAARRLLAIQAFSSSDNTENQIRLGAKSWLSKNTGYYDRQMSIWRRESALQFLFIYSHVPMTCTIPGRFNLPCVEKWNTDISNSSLVFSNNRRTVKRPGSVSSYPAAFANVPAARSSICIEIDSAFSGPNWLTFGLARRGMENSGSDGVGLTPETWGICDERDSSSEAVIASCGSRIGRCRKFRQGDIVKGVLDLAAGWFEVSVGVNSFTHRFEIPVGSCDDYYFAMTFANNHQVSIIGDPFTTHILDSSAVGSSLSPATLNTSLKPSVKSSVKSSMKTPLLYHLNTDHSEMYFNLKNMIIDICKSNDQSMFDYEFLVSKSSKWEDYIHRNATSFASSIIASSVSSTASVSCESISDKDMHTIMTKAYEEIKPFIELLTKDGRSTSDSVITSNLVSLDPKSIPTWDDILGAACWYRLHQERLERERQTVLSEEFIIEHQDSASFMAAVLLSPSMIESTPRENIARAKAYMKLNLEEMQSWYDYNAVMVQDIGESLVPGLENVPRGCRCLPRHVKSCPISNR